MEKDLGKVKKNETTEIIIRIDEYNGKKGLTIREFVTSERYTGFTKAGTRIPIENFNEFKEIINNVDPADLVQNPVSSEKKPRKAPVKKVKPVEEETEVSDEDLL
ncbi:MAG: hypothetical protein WC867_06445 [Candidatus Pacearchaeota archaeon]|jgi:hypothetical protein